MYTNAVRNTLGLLLGFIFGLLLTAPLEAQTVQDGSQAHPYLITQTGGRAKSLKCAAQNIAWTIQVDANAPVPAQGVTYSPNTGADAATYPFIADFPQAQMPAAIRTVGPHQLMFTQPATTITLADGTLYTYPAGSYSEWVLTLTDTPTTTPPKDNGWKKIIGTIVAMFKSLFKSFG